MKAWGVVAAYGSQLCWVADWQEEASKMIVVALVLGPVGGLGSRNKQGGGC